MNRVAAWLGPFTVTGAIVAVLGVVCYVAGWQLGWIELMVVAAGCLAALLDRRRLRRRTPRDRHRTRRSTRVG